MEIAEPEAGTTAAVLAPALSVSHYLLHRTVRLFLRLRPRLCRTHGHLWLTYIEQVGLVNDPPALHHSGSQPSALPTPPSSPCLTLARPPVSAATPLIRAPQRSGHLACPLALPRHLGLWCRQHIFRFRGPQPPSAQSPAGTMGRFLRPSWVRFGLGFSSSTRLLCLALVSADSAARLSSLAASDRQALQASGHCRWFLSCHPMRSRLFLRLRHRWNSSSRPRLLRPCC